jgi:nucleoside-diphosphate-sugar epimerase
MTMLRGRKILVTGASGQAAAPIAAWLARENEVWGVARYADDAARAASVAHGIHPCSVDVASGDFGALPKSFDHVLHFAFTRGGASDFDRALTVNGEGTGFVLRHCRRARSALVVSSAAIYTPHPDPHHAHTEDGELGRTFAPWSPTSPVSKIAEEAVARFCARAYGLPTTIVRLNTVYGSPGNLPSIHVRQIMAGKTVVLPWDPNCHSPIHVDDMCEQVEPLLDAARVPALTVNWAGDEVVSAQHWCARAGELAGVEARTEVREMSGVPRSNVASITRRLSLTGPCRVAFADGFDRLFREHHAAV